MILSVIIPVYRVEDTLDRCVKSVLGQQVDDMEVILVDDGSPDQCPAMCDKWAENDRRIKVVHQPNGGLSDARNAGIAISTGKCVTFVDSDDWLADNTYKPLLQLMGDCDILEFSIAGRLTLEDNVYDDISQYWLQGKTYTHAFAWNKIYRRELFSNVRYPKGKIFEDVYTLPLLLKNARKIRTTHLGSYHYCFNPTGITANAQGDGLAQLLEAHLTSGMPMDDRYHLYLVDIQCDIWESTHTAIVLPRRRLNPAAFSGIQKIKAITYNLFGIKFLCRTNSLIHLIKKPSRW